MLDLASLGLRQQVRSEGEGVHMPRAFATLWARSIFAIDELMKDPSSTIHHIRRGECWSTIVIVGPGYYSINRCELATIKMVKMAFGVRCFMWIYSISIKSSLREVIHYMMNRKYWVWVSHALKMQRSLVSYDLGSKFHFTSGHLQIRTGPYISACDPDYVRLRKWVGMNSSGGLYTTYGWRGQRATVSIYDLRRALAIVPTIWNHYPRASLMIRV